MNSKAKLGSQHLIPNDPLFRTERRLTRSSKRFSNLQSSTSSNVQSELSGKKQKTGSSLQSDELSSQTDCQIESGFICQFCRRKFGTLKLLGTHLSLNHSGTAEKSSTRCQEVVCKFCDIKFSLCTFCGKDCVSERAMKKHVRDHDSKVTFVCTLCSITLPRQDHETHLLSHYDVPALCSLCFKLREQSYSGSVKKHCFHNGVQNSVREVGTKKLVVSLERIKVYNGKLLRYEEFSHDCDQLKGSKAERLHSEGSVTSVERIEGCPADIHSDSIILEAACKSPAELGVKDSQTDSPTTALPNDGGNEIHETDDNHRAEIEYGELICEICDKTFRNSDELKKHVAIHMQYMKESNVAEGWISLKNDKNNIVQLSGMEMQNIGRADVPEEIMIKIDDAYFDPDFGVDSHANSSRTTDLKIDIPVATTLSPQNTGEMTSNTCLEQSANLSKDEVDVSRCELCEELLDSRQLPDHMKNHINGTDKVASSLDFAEHCCEICGIGIEDLDILLKHMKDHTGEDDEDQSKVLAREKDQGETFKCTICDEEFMDAEIFKNHALAHSDEKPALCEICGVGLCGSSDRCQHCESHSVDTVKVESQIEIHYFCMLCKRQFSTQGDYHNHLQVTCRENKPFCCDYCGMRFLTSGEVEKHASRHISGHETVSTDNEACQSREKLFKNTETLCNHKKLCKSSTVKVKKNAWKKGMTFNREKFVCSTCKKTFAYRCRLLQHMQVVHANYVCKKCGKTFVYKGRFDTHIKKCKHLRRVSKPSFLCKKCGSSFIHKNRFFDHLKKFHGTRPHERTSEQIMCKICSKTLRYKRSYENHLSKVHGIIKGSLPQFSCAKCNKTFCNKSRLQNHQKAHTLTK